MIHRNLLKNQMTTIRHDHWNKCGKKRRKNQKKISQNHQCRLQFQQDQNHPCLHHFTINHLLFHTKVQVMKSFCSTVLKQIVPKFVNHLIENIIIIIKKEKRKKNVTIRQSYHYLIQIRLTCLLVSEH